MRLGLAILTIWLLGWYIMGCKGMQDGYVDLSTGEEVTIAQDPQTGFIVNKHTREPLYIYVDPVQEDTIYAKTGEVINGRVVNKGNKFYYDKDEKLKLGSIAESITDSTITTNEATIKYKDEFADGDYKAKVKKDGTIKIKKGDRKVIIDGKTGAIHEEK